MKIKNVIHKGLRRFIEDDDGSGLPAQYVSKIAKIVSFLQDMAREDELRAIRRGRRASSPATGRVSGACSSAETGGSHSGSNTTRSRSST